LLLQPLQHSVLAVAATAAVAAVATHLLQLLQQSLRVEHRFAAEEEAGEKKFCWRTRTAPPPPPPLPSPPSSNPATIILWKFSKVSSQVILYSKFSSELTFENYTM